MEKIQVAEFPITPLIRNTTDVYITISDLFSLFGLSQENITTLLNPLNGSFEIRFLTGDRRAEFQTRQEWTEWFTLTSGTVYTYNWDIGGYIFTFKIEGTEIRITDVHANTPNTYGCVKDIELRSDDFKETIYLLDPIVKIERDLPRLIVKIT